MRIEKRDNVRERAVVVGMITDHSVLARLAPKWDEGGNFSSKWANLIGQWCVDFHETYGEAPGKRIEAIFEAWAEGGRDKEVVRSIDKLLTGLSEEYEQDRTDFNTSHVLDLAGEHFNRVRLTKLIDSMQAKLDTGKVEDAITIVNGYSKIETGVGAGVDLFLDEAAVRGTFAQSGESLVNYPGDVGTFLGDSLGRDCFVSFLGSDKVGKSFWLQDVAWRAMCQRRRVAFFEVGDQSEHQISMRFLVRAARHPRRSTNADRSWPCVVGVPRAVVPGDPPEVESEPREFESPLDQNTAWLACENVMRQRVKSKKSYFKLSVHPNSSVGVSGIKSVLNGWALDGWVPDVIVIDYADLLEPPPGSSKLDERGQINVTWKKLRALSQELHCLVITATQADAEAYRQRILDRRNFSGDKRKNAHVTGMIGINQTVLEKPLGVCRLNWLQLRDSDFNPLRCVTVAGCLPIADPCVRSSF